MRKFNPSFPTHANTALPVNYRTYSRKPDVDAPRETQAEQMEREFQGFLELADWTSEEQEEIASMMEQYKVMPSGRWKWVGGTKFVTKPENYYAAYNCCNIDIRTFEDLAHNFNLLMQGSGVGALIEYVNVNALPTINYDLNLKVAGEYGTVSKEKAKQETSVNYHWSKGFSGKADLETVVIVVGDTRQGWVDAYFSLLHIASSAQVLNQNSIDVVVDVSHVRPAGSPIKGFGGKTNPTQFVPMMYRVAEILNRAVGRQLNSVEVSLLLNEAAKCTVAGNVRRSARIDQFSWSDELASVAKENLWQQDAEGNWRIDPERDALRMANHTRILHDFPDRETIREAVVKQFYSAEGAIMFAPAAIARANADVLDTEEKQREFIQLYASGKREEATKLLL